MLHRTLSVEEVLLGSVSGVEKQGSESVKPSFPSRDRKVKTVHGKEAGEET